MLWDDCIVLHYTVLYRTALYCTASGDGKTFDVKTNRNFELTDMALSDFFFAIGDEQDRMQMMSENITRCAKPSDQKRGVTRKHGDRGQ